MAADAIQRPSGLTARLRMYPPVCPRSIRDSRPLATSHKRTVISSLAEARRRPSGTNTTRVAQASCSVSVACSRPVAGSQSLIVRSALDVASV